LIGMYIAKHSYSNEITNKKIAVIGPCPPPLGGVSVHVKRVMHKFTQQGNRVLWFNAGNRFRYRLFPLYGVQLISFLWRHRPDRVYHHTLGIGNGLAELYLLSWFKKLLGYKLIVVNHSCRYLHTVPQSFKKKLDTVMHKVDEQVFTGDLGHREYKQYAISYAPKVYIESAFLAPKVTDAAEIESQYPKELVAFAQKHSPLIIANAFQLYLLNGKDMYGFDNCLDAVAQLKEQYPGIGLLLALAAVGDHAHLNTLHQKITDLGIEKQVFFSQGQRELWPLFKQADLFVRPTLSDGASVSVDEALYFNVPVVASDVSARSPGVVLFKTGDTADFMSKIKEVLHARYQQPHRMYQKQTR